MSQRSVWEREYQDPKLVTVSSEPQNDFKRFIKWIRKEQKRALTGMRVLDLGSGTGKNSIFLAERGAIVTGIEISRNALKTALQRAEELEVEAEFVLGDIGEPFPFPKEEFDLALDVMSSNSLNEEGRETYVLEVLRVLKPGGLFFVRTLCKDGDKNAENLLSLHPGKEKDTYIMPGVGLEERVFSETDFRYLYEPHFRILKLERKTGYMQVEGRPFKRNYWLAYMQK